MPRAPRRSPCVSFSIVTDPLHSYVYVTAFPSLFADARVKILKKLVLHGRIAYKAQLLSLYRPRLYRGGEADKEVKEVTIITESTPDCPCVKMAVGMQYFIGGIYFGAGYKPLYILPNDGIIKRWNARGSFGRRINRCLITVDE